ncbi:hypothetical protein EMCG_02731 [[Emmonsia] crescens]|uniref:Uncharacterized protein n=1 Tax=[Emmonsia] crescens TaxID=73230 RepID=A0A0G2J8V4_9EURO|nr:hypothetical protein EMCG_02731 [Emmonsia crescens UAMH 3008]
MPEPISIAGTAAGLISLALQTVKYLVNFYSDYKHRDESIAKTTSRLQSILGTLDILEKTLKNREFATHENNIVDKINSDIYACEEAITELRDEFEKFTNISPMGFQASLKATGRKLEYPFRKSTLEKLNEDIHELQDNLSLTLEVLQLRNTCNLQDDVTDVKALLELVRASQFSSFIRDWLKAPDPVEDYHATFASRHPSTGLWFINDSKFKTWLREDNSFLWLSGFAGCGKSVLTTTAIEHTFLHRASDPCIGIALFYFNFRDIMKQDASPLMDSLKQVVSHFDSVYFIIDALDESPRNGEREIVLDTLACMRSWSVAGGLHILASSRDLLDIREHLNISENEEVSLKNAGVDKDISHFVSHYLRQNPKMRKWSACYDEIERALVERANGMFRWVECQFISIAKCRSKYHLDRALEALPRSLDETYQRMISDIDPDYIDEAKQLLTLLCFSKRPMEVGEVIDGLAIELSRNKFNKARRVSSGDDILHICPGLATIGKGSRAEHTPDKLICDIKVQPAILHIAHFSVKEYLISSRVDSKIGNFALEYRTANVAIAQMCLAYLLDPWFSRETITQSDLEAFPLAPYAALYWYRHIREDEDPTSPANQLALCLLKDRCNNFHNWARINHRGISIIPGPVYYAACLNLYHPLRGIIDSARSISSGISHNIKGKAGVFENALIAALVRRNDRISELLINEGLDVNLVQGWPCYGTALYLATGQGNRHVIELLISKGADVNLRYKNNGNALVKACQFGFQDIAELLIRNGANIDTKVGFEWSKHEKPFPPHKDDVTKFLPPPMPEYATPIEPFTTPLLEALKYGRGKIVELLIDKGARAI